MLPSRQLLLSIDLDLRAGEMKGVVMEKVVHDRGSRL